MILIINRSKKNGRRLSEMFHYMGILSFAATPTEALSELSPIYKAIIIASPETLPDCKEYISRINSYVRDIPIFALTDAAAPGFNIYFDEIFRAGAYTANMLKKIRELLDADSPGIYKLAGINASSSLNTSRYFNTALPLTKTENMIVRVLIKFYPNPTSAKKILKYAFKQSKLPELSSIRTHVSVINKKFRNIAGRNLIISESGSGYKILTPELIEKTLVNI